MAVKGCFASEALMIPKFSMQQLRCYLLASDSSYLMILKIVENFILVKNMEPKREICFRRDDVVASKKIINCEDFPSISSSD